MLLQEFLDFVNCSEKLPPTMEIEFKSRNGNAREGALYFEDLIIDRKNNKLYIKQRDKESIHYASGDF